VRTKGGGPCRGAARSLNFSIKKPNATMAMPVRSQARNVLSSRLGHCSGQSLIPLSRVMTIGRPTT
jgi:hypothetical protein